MTHRKYRSEIAQFAGKLPPATENARDYSPDRVIFKAGEWPDSGHFG